MAGEYYVCAELSRRGYVATLTLKNTEGIDILASRPRTGKAISIQVKTLQATKGHWVLNKKNESHYSDEFFYILVRLPAAGIRPAFHIVPSIVIADEITSGHKKWLAGPKKDGSARKDTSMRGFNDSSCKYLENWELLEDYFRAVI